MARISRRRRPERAGYSIAAILLLMATIAVMLGMARSLLDARQLSETSGINMVVGWLGGMLIGGMLGMSHQRRFNGLLVGILVGGIAGLCSGAFTGGGRFELSVIVIGSLAIVLFAGVVRAASKSTAQGDASPAEGNIAQLLKQMTPRQMLALALVLVTGIYAASKVFELLRDRSYLSVPATIGQVLLIVALMLLTAWMTRLVLRRPSLPDAPTELSAIDILDDPSERA